MSLVKAMQLRVETLRSMAAVNLQGHRQFRGSTTPACRELADWYEGRYGAYKKAAEMISEALEDHAC